MTRQVKFGRKFLAPAAFHWAVKVGDTWYEIAGKTTGRNEVNRRYGYAALSGAGSYGGELVGETNKTNNEIDIWIEDWIAAHQEFNLLTNNCQTFAWEFMDWLTESNFICSHVFDASKCELNNSGKKSTGIKTFARAEEGNAIARVSVGGKTDRYSQGMFSLGMTGAEAKVQAVAGPGLGAWADVSIGRSELSIGSVAGVHIDFNANTGAGVRNGNVDAHLLGFGGKIGGDGISVDTPIGGVSACSVM